MNQNMKDLVNGVNINWCWTKIKAMENKNANDYIFLARDNIKKIKNEKHYTSILISDIEKVKSIFEINNHLYEILPSDKNTKLYFDLEIERDGINDEIAYNLVIDFLHWVNNQIKSKFNINMVIDDYILLNSTRENKLSYHIISNNKMVFENMVTLKEFIHYLYDEMELYTDNEKFSWRYKDDKRIIFDRIPYSKDQCFRIINQSKFGKEHVLLPIKNCNIIDTFVRNYLQYDISNIIYSNTENLKENRKEKKIEKLDKKDKPFIDNKIHSLNKNGSNLLQKNNLSFDDIKIFPVYLQYLYLIPNESQPYDIFRNVGFALKSCGAKENEFRNWAKLSSKYLSKNSGRFINNFDNFLLGKQCLKLPYLKQLAKECCPDFFDEGISLMKSYFNPNYNNIRIIEEDTQYISSLNTTIQEKLIILKAQLGGGKTTSIIKFIKDHNYKRILFVSPRITFSQFISTEFDTAFYLDKDVNLNSDRLTISMESLHKLHRVNDYDCIVIDECEANLSVFSSITMRKNQIICFEILTEFIKKSKHAIFASAFITQKTIDYVNSFNIQAACIFNKTIPNEKRAYQFNEEILTIKLVESIQRNEKNYVVFSSKNTLNTVSSILRGLGLFETKKILIYSSEMDDVVIDTLKNIHKNWGEADLVMTSPSITVGNSYKPSEADFDNVFVFASPTCIVADTFQGMKRVRETRKNTLYFSLPDKSSLDISKRFSSYKFNLLKNYDTNNKNKEYQMKTIIQELITNYKTNEKIYESNILKLNTIFDCFDGGRDITPTILKDIIMFNYKEQIISDCYYEDVFNKFLEINNYICVKNIEEMNEQERKQYENLQNKSIKNEILYSDIPLIKDDKVEVELKQKQTYKKATRLEKMQLEKYYMLQKLNDNISDDYQSQLFKVFNKPNDKFIFINSYEEQLNNLDNSLVLHNITHSTLENMHLNPLKINYILKLNAFLGIENTCLLKQDIQRDKIESLSEFFKKELKNINILFGFNIIIKEKCDFSNILIILKKLYKSWNNSSFSTTLNNNRKVIKCNFIPNIVFYNNNSYSNPFYNNNTNLNNKIMTIEDSVIEQKNIEKSLKAIHDRKIEKSLPQPQRDVLQIAVCFMFSVLEFQLFLLVIIWFVLQPIATNDL